jgi:hypothetical protein
VNGPNRALRPKDEALRHLELLRRHGGRRAFEARLRDCVREAVELSDAYHSAERSWRTSGKERLR